LLGLVFACVAGGTASQNGKNAKSAANTSVAKGTVDACALLTSAEIEAIQGERVEELNPPCGPEADCSHRNACFARLR